MSNWDKITLGKFQEIEKINKRQDIDDLEKVLFSTCVIFNLTEYELNNAGVLLANVFLTKVNAIFSTPLNPVAKKHIGRYEINYDVSKMTFGQYRELAFFLQNPIINAHYILASISNEKGKPNCAKNHRTKADYFLTMPVVKVLGAVNEIIDSYQYFNKEYKDLFGLDEEVHDKVQGHFFNRRYGWDYSAGKIAQRERISLDDAYGLPVRQALNDLAYLKAEASYEAEQSRKNVR